MPMDDLALRYDRAASGWASKIARLGYPEAYGCLAARAGLPARVDRVLDAGCGTGAFAQAIARHVEIGAVDLLDNSKEMRSEAQRRLALATVPTGRAFAALQDEAVPPGAYGIVLAGHLVEHLDDPAGAVSWLATRLAPGGTLLLAVSHPHWCTALIRLVWAHGAYRPGTVTAWARQAGLGVRVVRFPAGPPRRTSMGYVMRMGDISELYGT